MEVPRPAKDLVRAGRKIKQNVSTETLQTHCLEDPPLPSRLVYSPFVHHNFCLYQPLQGEFSRGFTGSQSCFTVFRYGTSTHPALF